MTLLEVVLMTREFEGSSCVVAGVGAEKIECGGKRRVNSFGSRREYSNS